MFVFKAAVVGAGTMGGEIAQVMASADVPVVLKDVDRKFIDQGLEKARQVTEAQLGRLVKKEKLTQEQADAQLEDVVGRIQGTTEYEGFGEVDFVVEAGRSMPSHRATPSLPPTPPRSRSRRWRRPPAARTRWWASTSSIPPR